MCIVKVVDYVDFGGIETTNICGFLTEEKASDYCNNKNSIKKSIDTKQEEHHQKVEATIALYTNNKVSMDYHISLLEKEFYDSLTDEENEMHLGEDSNYSDPIWKYEELVVFV